MCERANLGVVADERIRCTGALDERVRTYDAIDQSGVGPDLASGSDARIALQHGSGIQGHVALNVNVNINKCLSRVEHGDSVEEPKMICARTKFAFGKS